ncbi:SDR family NAD(P)-dependent oxidoreductase [Sorangium sp. So ce1182]|uniref:SDR family NAD(P)-dependent oxidoreductase n=1 Tax=Sorangium sp. So ce1182 TaxID=3133334 RepID=UPI003F5F75B1
MKTWLITGASSGFGRALAEDVLARGDRVIAAARSEAALAELAVKAPDRVVPLKLDVRELGAIAPAIERAGAVDVLVNNAGYSIIGALEETDDETLQDVMATMFFGPAALTRAVLPQMRERKGGTIVQLTSVGGLTTAAGFGAYCAAKHALEGLSECVAKEVAAHGIRVLIVEPGAFRTNLFGHAFKSMTESAAYVETVGPTRAYVAQQAGNQDGDPAKAARAIVAAVAAGAPTLRLPLGADAVALVRGKLAEVAADMDACEAVATATAFTP